MNEKIYANKTGFKCVWSQLGKTDGCDPVEYEKNGRDKTKCRKVTKDFDDVQ